EARRRARQTRPGGDRSRAGRSVARRRFGRRAARCVTHHRCPDECGMRNAECGMARVFRGAGAGRARRDAPWRAATLDRGGAPPDARSGLPRSRLRASARGARARARQELDPRRRAARAGARATGGRRPDDGGGFGALARRPSAGRRLRPRCARARGVRAAWPVHPWRGRARVVRTAAAGAHPSLHARSPAQGDRAGNGRRLHALPVPLAARRPGRAGRGAGGARGRAGAARRRRADGRGASFFGDLVNATGLLRTEVEKGLGELVAWGLVTSDSFAGLRALLVPSDRRRPIGAGTFRRRGRLAPFGVETAGRWSRVQRGGQAGASVFPEDQLAEAVAWQLLRRYGVVFRRVVTRETLLAPWRDLLRVYRRLEARGEVRGGRFVGGFSGEQYALPEAVGLLRSVRRQETSGALVTLSGADPLNLVGIITPGDPLPALATNRVLYRDGIPVAVKEGEG